MADDVEAELQKMAQDPKLPAHLKLGVLKQLIALRAIPAPSGNGHAAPGERDDGLPHDPLLEQFPALATDDEGVVRNYSGEPLVAQRIKRLPSIRHKLERFPTLNVAQMQDLGGCRAVMATVEDVESVVDYYLNKSRAKHPLVRHDPYIEYPKLSGYRGVHIVHSYKSDKVTTWNGLKTELQIRTRLQHSWATAVETVGTFTRQALKSSQGQERWLRFFALMGTDHAMREDRPLVPETPVNGAELRAELRAVVAELDVINRLRAFGQTLRILGSSDPSAKMFLLELKAGERFELTLRSYTDAVVATDQYRALEEATQSDPGTDVVLVSVESVAALEKAYPNYFLDTSVFLGTVEDAIG